MTNAPKDLIYSELFDYDESQLSHAQLSIKNYFCAICGHDGWENENHMIGSFDGEAARLHISCSPIKPTWFV